MALKPTLSLTVLSNCPHCRGTSGRCRGSTVSDSSHSLGFPCTMASAAEGTAGGAGGGGNLGLVPCPPQYLSQPGAQQLTRRWNRTLTMNVPPSVLQVDLDFHEAPGVLDSNTVWGAPSLLIKLDCARKAGLGLSDLRLTERERQSRPPAVKMVKQQKPFLK